eukprot:CAMPEP_0116157440 /NCGR_PEP_ID=MMETSP0329-20121206/23345_1 /TAXON_ID=697910 /ORGANISM="Pseudo-nitzschia arenysensis, Strain B593" /LENGTH=2316 /DNA_ID=CAMNT_0003654547 /DNA_START=150 /DNA_END=7100 /DNA_ORIENTATION=-
MDTSNSDPASGPSISQHVNTTSEIAISQEGSQQIREEIPFLVTHWLANYGNTNTNNNDPIDEQQRFAMAKIKSAASELASAFTTLGAYGTTLRSSLELSSSSSLSSSLNKPVLENRTFSDVNRMHADLPPSHLENLAKSMAMATATADATALENAPTNYILKVNSNSAATANVSASSTNESATQSRNLQQDFDGKSPEEARENGIESMSTHAEQSILRNPALLVSQQRSKTTNSADDKENDGNAVEAEREKDNSPTIDLKSSHWEVEHQTAEAVRQYLTLREKCRTTDGQIRSLENSMALQKSKTRKLQEQMSSIGGNLALTAAEKIEKLERCKVDHQASDRVISQLARKLSELNTGQISLRSNVKTLEVQTRTLDKRRHNVLQSFRDPFESWKGSLAKGSRIGGCTAFKSIVGRELGLCRGRQKNFRTSIPVGANPAHCLELRKNILSTRLSHAVTINAHLYCPVYCLRFDRTGRYFITGADDFLLKVFYIGAAQSCKRHGNGGDKNRRLRCNYGANFRGAVLVCTLKGHAGVINDINVSMDNCFLATASVDGDVRVWGLKNGAPIAILRGHKGGANMVSWSKLTPYRLVSTGSDGFARVWDIREACLKRYGNMVGQRGEYNLKLTKEEEKEEESRKGSQAAAEKSFVPVLPPLPVRGSSANLVSPGSPDESQNATAGAPSQPPEIVRVAAPSAQQANGNINNVNDNSNASDNASGIIVPPLPAAVPPLGQGADGGNQNAEAAVGDAAPGQFVANDLIDEGVKLLSKYQHGNIQEEHGPGTRSRRAAVNVICVARCPLGKQFVTGSDDGICRVWEDFDDNSVAIIDSRLGDKNRGSIRQSAKPPNSGVEIQPLLKLMGHVSTITDLAYSHSGDRILSASQKDGVVRVWNIGIPTTTGRDDRIVFKDKRVTQIVIKLVNPFSNKSSKPTRRRPGNAARNASSKVCCDVATWSHDDSYIVTSQSILVKESGTDIQPGSLFVSMWDSTSGRCLMTISGAHTAQCQVVLPHPMDASILCTASTDGYVKVWDWSQGKCIFTHKNKNVSGNAENQKKVGGYLDGSFSPGGNVIVLTDDGGQITVLDSIARDKDAPNSGNELVWMKEQYFANDYYDLVYDRNGYCIERGSSRPPHLAPKSARCAANGSAYSDEINEAFYRLSGPSPLPENICTWQREQIRAKRFSNKYSISSFHEPSVRVSVREFDLRSTVVIKGVGHIGNGGQNSKLRPTATSAFGSSSNPQGGERNERAASRLSTNYRYLDYDDLVRREGNPEEDDPDSDDEEFEPVPARRSFTNNDNIELESDEDDDIDDLSLYSENNNRRRRRQRNQVSSRNTEERRARAQRRAQRNDADFLEIGSDDEMIAQFVSANRTPSGPYLRDYTVNGHYWRLKNNSEVNRVQRRWLSREESDSTYFGRNAYTPQLGDSIVYIPRAHFETIKECPSLSPPWQSWPMGAVWPVVRCFVRGIRFRFPYEDYFRTKHHAKCSSIVAILTLEVTGIPEISEDREFPWPKPSFIEPARPFLFELSVFENSSCEYIVPETLYTSRISALENHVRSRRGDIAGLDVDLYYEQEQGGSDLQVWPATIEAILPDEGHSDVHLQGSGFGSVQVWDGSEENRDFVSPWELNTEGVNLTRPCMSENEKDSVLKELNRLLRKDDIANHLSMPVDQVRYCDYENMVEIPMDIMFIKRRLAANYYGSKLGAAADLRLIRDNCIKYNTDENEMSEIAETMCTEFEQNVLSEEERLQMISEEDFENVQKEQSEGRQVSSMRIRLSARTIQEASQAAASSGGRYTLRERNSTQDQSTLETLPQPDIGSTQRQRTRRNSNSSDVSREVNNPRGRGLSNETEVLGNMSRLRTGMRDTSARGRSLNNGRNTSGNENAFSMDAGHRTSRRQRIPESEDFGRRRSARSRNVSYNDESDGDEINATARRSTRRNMSRNQQEFQNSEDVEQQPAIAGSTGSRRTRSSRSTRRAASSEDDHAEDSDSESHYLDQDANHAASSEESDLEEASPPPKRSRTSQRTRRASSREPEPPVEPAGRRSSRRDSSTRSTTYEEVESDAEQYRSESEASEISPVNRSRNARRNARASPPVEPSPAGRSSRRNAAKKRSAYEEVESDEEEYMSEPEESSDEEVNIGRSRRHSAPSYAEVDSDVDEESDEEEESPPRRNTSKRKRQAKKPPAKKKARGELPNLRTWPKIPMCDITQVTKEMLRRASEDDEGGIFASPVLEAHPGLIDAYLNVIDMPMDRRTIEEDRMNIYTEIHMLQDDLIRIFRNCCAFNGAESELGAIAIAQWENINHNFAEVCEELGILLPRHWKP